MLFDYGGYSGSRTDILRSGGKQLCDCRSIIIFYFVLFLFYFNFLVHHDRTVTSGHWAVPQWDQLATATRLLGSGPGKTHQPRDIYAAS